MPEANSRHVKYWRQYQEIATVDEDPPVVNTWYELLNVVDVMAQYFVIRQINDETVAKNYEARVTADGVVMLGTLALNNNTWYYVRKLPYQDTPLNITADATLMKSATALFAHALLLELRQTGALGTNQNLDGRATYELELET